MVSTETDNLSESIKAYCLRLLARREHSQKELLNKCLANGFNKTTVLTVIEALAEKNWQSDRRYAESYARSRIQKGYGPVAIAYELSQQGIDDLDLDALVAVISGSWLDLLEQVYHKKYHDHQPLDHQLLDRKEWAKRYQFLMQRGFSGSLINTLFQRYQKSANRNQRTE